MAWKELLRSQDGRDEDAPQPERAQARDRGGLIRQAQMLFGQSAGENDAAPPESGEEQAPAPYRDGYVRRSPVQPYRTAENYTRRRVRRAVTAVVILIVVLLLIFALMRAGLLVFRLR